MKNNEMYVIGGNNICVRVSSRFLSKNQMMSSFLKLKKNGFMTTRHKNNLFVRLFLFFIN